MATLTVGLNKQYPSIATALEAARDGDIVAVSAGLYVNDFGVVRAKVTLTAVGGKATLLATTALATGKALLTVATDSTVDGFVFAGAKAADGTAAGLLDTGGALVVRNSLFTGNQNGLVVQGSPAGSVSIQASEFAGNGAGDGFSANIAVGPVASLLIQDSFIHDAAGGDEVRSLAKATTITGSRIIDSTASVSAGTAVAGTGTAGLTTADVSLPKGGVVVIKDSVIEKGPDTAGPAIRLGGDAAYAATSLTLSNDTLIADRPGTVAVQNTTTAVAVISNDTLYGFSAIASGPAVLSNDVVATVRPAVSAAPLVVPSVVLPSENGRAGAVTANGTVLTVGGTGAFRTLAAALAAAKDGDTIRVAAGTYTETGVTVDRKVIIEGTGGLARFVGGNGSAVITTTADATLRNIEVTGATVLGGVAAGIRDQAGRLTLVNSFVHDNGAGLVVEKGAGTVGVYDTELARNGTVDGRGANLDVAEVGTLTLRNAWVHDAPGGAEIRSRADNTVIDGTRVLQTLGSAANAIDLPNSGRATISGSVVEKGAWSLGGSLIHVGGDTAYAASAVTLTGNTLISDVTTVGTRFVVAEGGAGPVSASGTVFEGGAAGSVQAVNAVNTGAVVRTGLTVSAAAPWGSTGAPAAGAMTAALPARPAAQRGVMVVRISEDAYRGDARFTLSVDGVQVGDTLTATALHGKGQSQSFTVAGDFAPGPHVVGVTLVNDLSSGKAGEDRNLYVDGLGFNGEDMHQVATLTANGTALLSTGAVTRSTPVVVNLSEDAWKGDAQAVISIDGKVQGGILEVTASHAAGRTQAMSFLLDLAPGAHTVGVTFINDAKGAAGEDRNLYVDSVDIAGTHYAMAAATLATNGSSTFAFTVAPPPAANAGLFLTAGLPQAVAMLPPLG